MSLSLPVTRRRFAGLLLAAALTPMMAGCPGTGPVSPNFLTYSDLDRNDGQLILAGQVCIDTVLKLSAVLADLLDEFGSPDSRVAIPGVTTISGTCPRVTVAPAPGGYEITAEFGTGCRPAGTAVNVSGTLRGRIFRGGTLDEFEAVLDLRDLVLDGVRYEGSIDGVFKLVGTLNGANSTLLAGWDFAGLVAFWTGQRFVLDGGADVDILYRGDANRPIERIDLLSQRNNAADPVFGVFDITAENLRLDPFTGSLPTQGTLVGIDAQPVRRAFRITFSGGIGATRLVQAELEVGTQPRETFTYQLP